LRHGHPRHHVVACRAALVQGVAQDRERVEERRKTEVEVEDLALQRRRPAPEVERPRPTRAPAFQPQAVADEAGPRLQRIVEAVVQAELSPLRGEPVSLQVDERDLEPRLVEPAPGIDTSPSAQNSSSFRTASTTRSTEGM
jgi:hypothetical protein